jgi:hypothetical protein
MHEKIKIKSLWKSFLPFYNYKWFGFKSNKPTNVMGQSIINQLITISPQGSVHWANTTIDYLAMLHQLVSACIKLTPSFVLIDLFAQNEVGLLSNGSSRHLPLEQKVCAEVAVVAAGP